MTNFPKLAQGKIIQGTTIQGKTIQAGIVHAHCVTWRILAAISVAVAATMHVVMASTAKTPSFPYDELSLFQYARNLSGTVDALPVGGAGYFPAWAFMLAPIWWITNDPLTFYRIAIWFGVVLALATIWPLALLVRRFGINTEQSIMVASLVMAMPSRSVQAAYALSEKLLFLVVVCAALAACRLWERMSPGRIATFAVLVAAAQFTHVRAAVVVIVSMIWLATMIPRRRRTAIVALIGTGVLAGAAYGGAMLLNEAFLDEHFKQGSNLGDNLIFFFTRPDAWLRVFVSQLWAQCVASLGIIVIGGFALVAAAVLRWRESGAVRHGARSEAESEDPLESSPQGNDHPSRFGPEVWILAVFLAAFALSVFSWGSPLLLGLSGDLPGAMPKRTRLDPWLYGRYVDPFAAPVIAAGLAALCKGVNRRVLLRASALVVTVLLLAVFAVAPGAPTWGTVTPGHVPGILPWNALLPFDQSPVPNWISEARPEDAWTWLMPSLTNANRFWPLASLTVAVFLALCLVARRMPSLISSVLIVATAVAGVFSYPAVVAYQAKDGGVPSVVTQIEDVRAQYGPVSVVFDHSCVPATGDKAWAQNAFAFWLQSEGLAFADSPDEFGDGLVIGCTDLRVATGIDATRVGDAESIGYVLWAMPGALSEA